ncbi:MAG: siderophore-interacting protein [Marmoricola sp.]|jgi:NADPH-dependent ferric siderophore reductase|nr:siderophore-interacting protein [Marmoricola sp.]
MTVDVESIPPNVLIAQAHVRRTERISPAFVRVTLESPTFEDLGIGGFDTRFKMVLPGPTGQLPEIPAQAEQWYARWMAMPETVKSPMRTYTVRDVVEEDGASLLVVDLVVHEHGPHGPACRWALGARPGDAIQVIAPHRASREYGGTEFDPGERNELLLIADETAVPALTRILADLGPTYTGHAFIEVPSAQDILTIDVPGDIKVTWLTRRDADHGRRLAEEVRDYLGLGPLDPTLLPAEVPSDLDVEVWETPRYSSSGEEVEAQLQPHVLGSDLHDLYSWIAGESWMVKALRRSLVSELGLDRSQVAFMGYWREGVSMRS